MDPGQYVQVSVTDRVSVSRQKIRSRIFEPFFTTKGPGQRHWARTRYVYGIVRQAGGALVVETEQGRGSTFHILLPVVKEALSNQRSTAESVAPQGTETILIAEDESGVRKIARMIFRTPGLLRACCRARSRGHTNHVRACWADSPITNGRSDAGLGRKCTGRNRTQAATELRVLYMSGYTDDAVVRSGVEAERDWFIQKPFTVASLARRVREVLDAARAGSD